MNHTTTTATFILLLLSLSTTFSAAEKCHPSDKSILLSIKKSFNDAYQFASWTNTTDCCKWYMVKCDIVAPYRIISLSVGSYITSGTIPDAVGDLPYLQDLTFRKLPNLVGTIPSSIGKLQRLVIARFDHNSLSGPVPSFFYRMGGLTELDLSFNQFSGSIPPQIGLIPSIVSLDISRNSLSGPIPESFGHFKMAGKSPEIWGTLFSLSLSHNQLSGPIPTSLGNVNFSSIDLSRNNITGDASFLFGTNKPLQIIDLSRNEFSFNFSSVEILTGFGSLDLNHNQIFGGFPLGMENVQNLNVSYNRLCGAIPSVGSLPTFDQSVYAHNKCLCGTPLAACN